LEPRGRDTLQGALVNVVRGHLIECDALLVGTTWPTLAQIGKALLEEPHGVRPFGRTGALAVLLALVTLPDPVDRPTLVVAVQSDHAILRCARSVRIRRAHAETAVSCSSIDVGARLPERFGSRGPEVQILSPRPPLHLNRTLYHACHVRNPTLRS